MKKITQKAKKEFVKHKLHTNPVWAKTALLRIFELQTDDEKYYETTRDANGVGFTGADGEILSSFAKHLEKTGYLSAKQMAITFNKMPKYWKQIIGIAKQPDLDNMILQNDVI